MPGTVTGLFYGNASQFVFVLTPGLGEAHGIAMSTVNAAAAKVLKPETSESF